MSLERDRRVSDEAMGELKGQVSIIRDLLSDHIKVSRVEREDMKKELSEIKSEITKYKFFFRAVVGTIIAIATLKFGDISSLWG